MTKKLTQRECQVLELIGKGMTSKQVAAALSVSINTVNAHRASIRAKKGFASAIQMIRYAGNLGLQLQPKHTKPLNSLPAEECKLEINSEEQEVIVTEKPNIVIADHDRQALKSHLDALAGDYNIVHAENGRDALKAVKSEPKPELGTVNT